ncbi:hypothetical protein [Flavobacterium davisii]|uniref:hypothetical protein n=1 Tax=Flavobacterium davisii TaxID=2906077 RepID=UPI0035D0C54F
MKWFLLLLLLFEMGYAQKTFPNYNIIEPIVTKDFEKFDYDFFNKNKKTDENESKKIYYIEKTLDDGTYIEMYEGVYKEIKKGNYFKIIKTFYKSNGTILVKGLTLNNNIQCKIGTWYEFSEDGKLIKETNYDEPYKFTFEKILQFCEKEKIPLTKGPITNGVHSQINRTYDEKFKQNVWYVSWFKQTDLIEIFVLDGESGKLLEKRYMNYINN